MATLKPYQVAAAALLGGFSPNDVPTAVAVARGESSFQTDKCTGQYCGLWQIGTDVNKEHLHGGDWKNPVVNARAAKELVDSRGWCGGKAPNGHCQNFEAYGLDNAGMSWKAKLAEGAKAYAEVQLHVSSYGETLEEIVNSGMDNSLGFDLPGPSDIPGLGQLIDVGSAITGFAKAVVDFANKIGGWVSDTKNWIRVAEVIGGGLLMALGLRIAFNTQINALTKQVVSMVVPAGKAAKAATMARKVPR